MGSTVGDWLVIVEIDPILLERSSSAREEQTNKSQQLAASSSQTSDFPCILESTQFDRPSTNENRIGVSCISYACIHHSAQWVYGI